MKSNDISFLTALEQLIRERLRDMPDASYTAKLASAGDKRIAQKVGEEALELALAAVAGNRAEQLDEASDLMFHLLLLLARKDLCLAQVAAHLESRHRQANSH